MSIFMYNGVTLDLARVRRYSTVPTMSPDGTDYLYSHISIDVDCIYNPAATAYDLPVPGSGDPPAASPGTMAPVTALAIRERLMENRRPLFWKVGPTPIVDSPGRVGHVTDAKTGPHPIGCHVREVVGTRTFLVSYQIETWLRECEGDDLNNPVLSNRWQQQHTIDELQGTTVQTQGVAIFDLGRLTNLKLAADHFRSYCLPGIMSGFQRKQIQVAVSPVGDTLTWMTIDQEMRYALGDNNHPNTKHVVRFQATETVASIDSPTDVAGGGMAGDPVLAIHSIHVRAEGNTQANTANLLIFCVKVATIRLGIPRPPAVRTASDPIVSRVEAKVDLHQAAAELHISVRTFPPDPNLPPPAAAPPGPPPGNVAGLGVPMHLLLTPNAGSIPGLFANDGKNKQPPNDANTRGTFKGEIFAQEIREACAQPSIVARPKDNDTITDVADFETTATVVDIQVADTLLNDIDNYNPNAYTRGRGGIVTAYRIMTTYRRNYLKVVAPVAGRLGPSVPPGYFPAGGGGTGAGTGSAPGSAFPADLDIIYAGRPHTTMVVKWTAERMFDLPPLPSPIINDPNYELMETFITPMAPPSVDGVVPAFRISGEYWYAMRNGKGAGDDGIFISVLPWTSYQPQLAVIRATDFFHDVIDGGPPTGNPGYPTGGGGFSGLGPDF